VETKWKNENPDFLIYKILFGNTDQSDILYIFITIENLNGFLLIKFTLISDF